MFAVQKSDIKLGRLYIRVNQAGYAADKPKFAVAASTGPTIPHKFVIVDSLGKRVLKGKFSTVYNGYGPFKSAAKIDFSSIKTAGRYNIIIAGTPPVPIVVTDSPYLSALGILLQFFRYQRCGDTAPIGHLPCHPNDATRVDGVDDLSMGLDLTGGWHDAADYLKFVITTAHTVYCLILAGELDVGDSWSDQDNDGMDDAVQEAMVGLEWLKKMNFRPGETLIQIQDLRDHNYQWRLPENDSLAKDRPAYYRPSKALNGAVAATFAIAAKRMRELGHFKVSADLINRAETLFNATSVLPDCSSGPDSMYFDRTFKDNLALAAAELYIATGKDNYLMAAEELLDDQAAVHWVSWGDLAGIAYARLGNLHPDGLRKLESSLAYFDSISTVNPFSYPLDFYPWGSAAIQAGVAMTAVLHALKSGDARFVPLAERQLEHIFGVNIFGISYVNGVGNDFTSNFHHPLARLGNGRLTGAFAEGPVARKQINNMGIQLALPDRFEELQSELAVYHDDWNNYLTNEPTIVGNAQLYLAIRGLSALR